MIQLLAQSTSSLIQSSTYTRYNEETTTFFSDSTFTTFDYATTPLEGETSTVPYDTLLTNVPMHSTKIFTPFLQMATYSTANPATLSTTAPATFSKVIPATISTANPATVSTAKPAEFSTANLTTIITSRELQFSSKPLTPSSVVSSMLNYSSHLPYKSSSTSADIQQSSQPLQRSNELNSTLAKKYVTLETKPVLTNTATINSIRKTSSYVVSSHETSSYETSRSLTASYTASSLPSIQNRTSHSVVSILDYSFNGISSSQFTSTNASHNKVTSKYPNNVVTKKITEMISSTNKPASSVPPAVTSSTASPAVPPQSDKSGIGNTANSKASWKVGLSAGVPIAFVTLLVIAGWFYVAKYKKVSTITPREDDGMIENGKGIKGLKYRMEDKNE